MYRGLMEKFGHHLVVVHHAWCATAKWCPYIFTSLVDRLFGFEKIKEIDRNFKK
jgi:hypothetical protein